MRSSSFIQYKKKTTTTTTNEQVCSHILERTSRVDFVVSLSDSLGLNFGGSSSNKVGEGGGQQQQRQKLGNVQVFVKLLTKTPSAT